MNDAKDIVDSCLCYKCMTVCCDHIFTLLESTEEKLLGLALFQRN